MILQNLLMQTGNYKIILPNYYKYYKIYLGEVGSTGVNKVS